MKGAPKEWTLVSFCDIHFTLKRISKLEVRSRTSEGYPCDGGGLVGQCILVLTKDLKVLEITRDAMLKNSSAKPK